MHSAQPGVRTLSISHGQLEAIRDHLARGAENLSAVQAPDTRVRVEQVRVERLGICQLADFPAGALFADDDCSAAVLARFDGSFCATALLALDPADALRWVRAHEAATSPLETYRHLANQLLCALVEGMAVGFSCEAQPGPVTFEERSLVAILLGTHAPSDTLVLSARLEIDTPDALVPAHLYLLFDPKRLMAMLESLSETPRSAGDPTR